MTTDQFKPVRDHLVVACNLLAGKSERTKALSDRVRAVERQMDWRGDPHVALSALPAIIAELAEIKETRGGCATATPTQDDENALNSGVADAIAQLESAVTLLRA